MLALLLLLTTEVACTAETTFMGRTLAPTMSHLGAPWLTRDTRAEEEGSDRLHQALSLQPGEVACDVGAGNGYHTLPMARAVGPQGRVKALDIQPEMLDLLATRAQEAGLSNIDRVQSTQVSLGLPPATCDLALLVDVYHELAEPAAMLASLYQTLKVDGELVLVEYREEDPTVPIKPLHKMSKAQVHRELTAHGFKLVRERDDLPWQHLMVYQRADGPDPAQRPEPWRRAR